jgi:hypothetical protein
MRRDATVCACAWAWLCACPPLCVYVCARKCVWVEGSTHLLTPKEAPEPRMSNHYTLHVRVYAYAQMIVCVWYTSVDASLTC